jgi:hypothetical protein
LSFCLNNNIHQTVCAWNGWPIFADTLPRNDLVLNSERNFWYPVVRETQDAGALVSAETAAKKFHNFVIPRHASCRGISLFLGLNRREIPRFARNDNINYFFRSPLKTSSGSVALRHSNVQNLSPSKLQRELDLPGSCVRQSKDAGARVESSGRVHDDSIVIWRREIGPIEDIENLGPKLRFERL